MQIVLLTIWHVGNYGAEMQTYATVKALQRLGHKVQVIDYRLNWQQGIKAKINHCILAITPASRKFNAFWDKHIPYTRQYFSTDDLHRNLPEADLYLVGSDQVWNPAITKEKCLDYFLSFVPSGKRRASYASSMGISKWITDAELTEKIKDELLKFEKISCRESDGIDILKNTFNINATRVLDPTLLFSNYPELIGEVQQKNTFVYYPLFGGSEMECFCKETAQDLGMQYINNNRNTYWLYGRLWDRLPIEAWVKNFAEAKFIATQSFHGTAFSIIHGKQFFTVYNGNKVSRIANLLEALGLRDRLYPTVADAKAAKPWMHIIDYTKVNKHLEYLRKNSWIFLKDL